MKEENIQVTEVLPSEVNEQLFDTQIVTAKKYPRNINNFLNNAIATVTRSEATASTCMYALPRGGKKIPGPSVHLARIMSQLYGNLRVQVKAGEIGLTFVTASAIAFDLETNYAIQVDSRRKITDRNGKRYNEDMINITMLVAMAIAERNAIFKVIPKALVDELYGAAQRKITGDLSSEEQMTLKRKETVNFFDKHYGVKEADLLELLGKTTINQVTADDIVTLRGLHNALKDGETTVEEQFPRFKKAETKKKTNNMFDEKEGK
jgi:molybdopterin converting factor small subunit